MAKIKYKFNPETLSYEKLNRSIGRQLLRILPPVISVGFVSFLLSFFVIGTIIDSPKDKKMKQENAQYEAHFIAMNERIVQLEKIVAELGERDDNIYRSLFNQKPIPNRLRNPGVGGTNSYEDLEKLSHSDLIISVAKKLDMIERQVVIQSKSYDKLTELASKRKEMLNSIPAIIPVKQKDMNGIVSYFGPRKHPILGYVRMHSGIDISAPKGTKVYASGDGTVVDASWNSGGYGRMIVIDHGFGYRTVYAHLHAISVRKGQTVKRGEIIGKVGSTGLSVSSHLHYEVRINNKPVDPINFFFKDMSPVEYDAILQDAANSN
ncbi:MAG: M23 family metallopeptidase [Bacteroidales bacterium]|nr:M23 family metallopeptidase [Bacteroidales bacterium]